MKGVDFLAKRILKISPELAFKYLNYADEVKKDVKIISFGIGQPDYPTPKLIRDSVIKAINEGKTGYVSASGIPELRKAIARHVNSFLGIDVKPKEVIITPGTKTAIYFSIISYIQKGDEVIITDPSFFVYESLIKYAGGKPVYVQLKEENNFRFLVEDVKKVISNKTKMIFINSPNNPTGSVNTADTLEELLFLAKEKNLVVASDEIYDHFVYERKHSSVLNYPEWRDNVIYINGFSKTYSMTGWRLGYAIAREDIINKFEILAMNNFSCTNNFVQCAGITALEMPQEFFKGVLKEYKERRDFLYNELNKISGIKAIKPNGAFYIYPNIKKIIQEKKITTSEFTLNFIKEKGVVTIPGVPGFSQKAGEGYIRLAFTISTKQIKEGLERLKEFI